MKRIFGFLVLVIFVQASFSQSKNEAYINYISEYQEIAMKQHKLHGIPASIILAQGLLESGAGKSSLAVNANNHFGIKCHDWSGEVVYHDDDARNECFRKYKKAVDSFEDHSQFLATRSRYQSLFQLNSTDYIAWAHGLKAAGYATDPSYAQKLINLIQLYELYEYDRSQASVVVSSGSPEIKQEITTVEEIQSKEARKTYRTNYIRVIIATEGDTYASLAEELDISEKDLRKFNEAKLDMEPQEGDFVYLAQKRKKATFSTQVHIVREGESLYSISQQYGIRVSSLYEINDLPYEQGAYVGQIVKLR